jgi:phosphoribosylaminoimidazole carboxylase (NCAIR synthetase)
LPFQYGLELTFHSQAEAWEADAVGQEAAVEEVVAVDAEVVVVVARMLNYEHDEGMEWEVG